MFDVGPTARVGRGSVAEVPFVGGNRPAEAIRAACVETGRVAERAAFGRGEGRARPDPSNAARFVAPDLLRLIGVTVDQLVVGATAREAAAERRPEEGRTRAHVRMDALVSDLISCGIAVAVAEWVVADSTSS